MEEKATRRASSDFLYFLDTFTYTLDEHDPDNPIKKIPMDKDYLRELAELYTTESLILVEKSRQMMVTWLTIAYCLWVAMFHEGRRVFVQSKKEKDANANIDRAKFIYSKLPKEMRMKYKANEPMAYLKLEFGKHNSIIEGTPQGPDQLRQYTASVIFSDEMAFQEKAESAYIAAQPTIMGGGQFIGVSSPNFKEFFYRTSHDIE